MKGAGFEFIFRVSNNGELISEVESDVATLATSGIELKKEAALFGQLPQPLDELVAFHRRKFRAILTECQGQR